ncbi:unnamed protein product [Strongylus vulgaris]|uniref:FAD-dependent oxidoreductase 2 FAD-binding domain-containing protein n=1 Tax=Strongylus vulgaris TaxID=40348 RepID=A0A3P7JNP1_STRVU|nr:unnamed protein product [Strongylus vulgaris]
MHERGRVFQKFNLLENFIDCFSRKGVIPLLSLISEGRVKFRYKMSLARTTLLPVTRRAIFSMLARSLSGTQEADIVVIGSGPGGYVAAIKAAQLGMKV